jgi:hypothetical protein
MDLPRRRSGIEEHVVITDTIGIPSRINVGITAARQATMLSLLGNPRSNYDDVCREVTNPKLKALIELSSVGPFRVQGLKPAVESLKRILEEVRVLEPDVHDSLGNAGMLCARLVRGSRQSISNHSWGTAIDVTLDGVLDTRGDNRVQQGLSRIAPIFNTHGWFWGAGFRVEDAMHFEVGDDLVRRWHDSGLLGASATPLPDQLLTVGDRGPDVVALQKRLNELGSALTEDGVFGTGTHAAVMAFQAEHGLPPDGAVGPRTRAALQLE